MNLPKGETLPGNLEFGTQDRTETLKGDSQDARKWSSGWTARFSVHLVSN